MLVSSVPQYVQGLTNAKVDLTSTSITTLYTAPSSGTFNASIVSSILVSDDSGSGDSITLTLTNGSDVYSLFKSKTIGTNDTEELLTRDLILQGGEILKVTAATADRLYVVASIQEFNQSR
jgi:molybdopterin-binding protein|tara:strand:+ start:270 stop:632 length:363 start_codon:yes stop_codon:yes gene_type:complete